MKNFAKMTLLLSLMVLLFCCLKWAWLSLFPSSPSPEDEPSISSDQEHSTQESDAQQQQQQQQQEKEKEEEDLCAVCLCGFGCEGEETTTTTTTLRCNHYFHKVCIDKWFAKRETCPLCRDRTSSVSSSWSWLDDDDEISVDLIIVSLLRSLSSDDRSRSISDFIGNAT
ncbi:hypothetical protein Tsubulata_018156 [Turnera subulata]|uniref:RING-type domain-containing protein n=1 Tax=Turnera subulata TaxID=218843 RepID=A0A9Q0JH63_9ROSI|nr:hypothetical protein Tsubulata_018156 [Turnera subulata]